MVVAHFLETNGDLMRRERIKGDTGARARILWREFGDGAVLQRHEAHKRELRSRKSRMEQERRGQIVRLANPIRVSAFVGRARTLPVPEPMPTILGSPRSSAHDAHLI